MRKMQKEEEQEGSEEIEMETGQEIGQDKADS